MPKDVLQERLARLDPKPSAPALRKSAKAAAVEFMPAPQPRKPRGRRLGAMLTLALAAAVLVKGGLLALNGSEGFDAWRQDLAASSPEKQLLALVLYPDPVTVFVADQMTPAPEEEAPPSPFAHLRHGSGITMIQAKQAPTEDVEAASD